MIFSSDEHAACQRLVAMALEEDVGSGDVTSRLLIPADLPGRAVLAARGSGVLAGLPAAAMVFAAVDPRTTFQPLLVDCSVIRPGDKVAEVSGYMRSILLSERIALNFLQHLSGVATQTHRCVEAVAGLPCQILDTRKTLPGWRRLQKYAVRCGGGRNHRMGLYDGVLIKDNHLAALGDASTAVARAVQLARTQATGLPVEIEVDSLSQLDQALEHRPDIVLLDNMSVDQLRKAVERRNAAAPDVLLEASGGITPAMIRSVAEAGVDRISIGALTHSVIALDIALDYVSP